MANLFSTISPQSSVPGFLERMASLPGKRYDDFMEQTRRYQSDEIGLADQILQGGANALGMLTDIPFAAAAEAVSTITPDFIKKGIQQLAQGISETEAAQAAMQYAQENPQVMKRLGYIADLSVVPTARIAKQGGMLKDLSMEASNRQPWFYGSGRLGQLGSAAVTAPTALVDTLRPAAAASRREGMPMSVRRSAAPITPERRETAREIEKTRRTPERRQEVQAVKDIKEKIKNEEEVSEQELKFIQDFETKVAPEDRFMSSYNKDLSFVEGQLDQTQLLSRGRDLETQGIIKSFEKVQQLDGGKLDADILQKSEAFSKTMADNNIKLDKNTYAVFEERIRKAQKIGPTEEVEVVIRNPKAFSDLEKEALWKSSGSPSSRRVLSAKKAIDEHFPKLYSNLAEFGEDELKEVVAMTKLPDDSLYNLKTKKPAGIVGKTIYKLTESKKYGKKTSVPDSEIIDQYYKYKKMELNGKNFTKPQKEKWESMKARVQKIIQGLDFRGDSVYFSDSHRSAAKGLGGVNDQYMMNTKGDLVAIINDENDWMNLTVPGDKRVISVTPPQGINLFAKGKKGPVNKELQQLKKVFQQEMKQAGAEPVSMTPKGMLEQAAVAIQRQDLPQTQLSDYRNLATTTAYGAQTSRER